jgi:hypothetical protein
VKLKSPFEDPLHNFGGKFNPPEGQHPAKPAHSSYNVNQDDLGLVLEGDQDSTDYMDGGYKGLPNFNFPGLHDDRPDFSTQNPVKRPAVGKVQEHFHKYPALKNVPSKGNSDDDDSDFLDYSDDQVSMLLNLFPSLLMTRPNKLKCLYLAITFQSSLTFAGNTRSLPKKEAFERRSNWGGSGLALKF